MERLLLNHTEKNHFRQSSVWKDFRIKLLNDRGYRCQCCGVTKKKGLQIHHLFPSEYDNLDPDRFAVLCPSCHNTVSRIERIKHREKYNSDFMALYLRFIGE